MDEGDFRGADHVNDQRLGPERFDEPAEGAFRPEAYTILLNAVRLAFTNLYILIVHFYYSSHFLLKIFPN